MSEKGLKAQGIIRNYAIFAGGLAFIPLRRFAGQVAVGGVLLSLLGDLCRIYGISFSDQQNKILIASILGGAHYHWVGRYLMKFINVYSPAALLLNPAVSAALVYYIGRLFLVHLESAV